jgi:hypothetical protein
LAKVGVERPDVTPFAKDGELLCAAISRRHQCKAGRSLVGFGVVDGQDDI